ncbi:dihydropyrimidinase, partial [Colletotrichum scovillei]
CEVEVVGARLRVNWQEPCLRAPDVRSGGLGRHVNDENGDIRELSKGNNAYGAVSFCSARRAVIQ